MEDGAANNDEEKVDPPEAFIEHVAGTEFTKDLRFDTIGIDLTWT